MLKTDYKNDVYTGNRKYLQANNTDGTVSFTDVTDYTQEGDVFGSSDINATNEAVNELYKVIQVTLTASGWTGSSVPYSQTVSNSAISADYDYEIVSQIGADVNESTAKAYNKAFGIICSGPAATSANGSATFKVFKKPSTDITIGLKVRMEA